MPRGRPDQDLAAPESSVPAKVFYDSNVEVHHHFYNVDDGILTDVDPAEVPIEQLPHAPIGTVAEAVDIVIRIRNSL